jgi:hypothetical protein
MIKSYSFPKAYSASIASAKADFEPDLKVKKFLKIGIGLLELPYDVVFQRDFITASERLADANTGSTVAHTSRNVITFHCTVVLARTKIFDLHRGLTVITA